MESTEPEAELIDYAGDNTTHERHMQEDSAQKEASYQNMPDEIGFPVSAHIRQLTGSQEQKTTTEVEKDRFETPDEAAGYLTAITYRQNHRENYDHDDDEKLDLSEHKTSDFGGNAIYANAPMLETAFQYDESIEGEVIEEIDYQNVTIVRTNVILMSGEIDQTTLTRNSQTITSHSTTNVAAATDDGDQEDYVNISAAADTNRTSWEPSETIPPRTTETPGELNPVHQQSSREGASSGAVYPDPTSSWSNTLHQASMMSTDQEVDYGDYELDRYMHNIDQNLHDLDQDVHDLNQDMDDGVRDHTGDKDTTKNGTLWPPNIGSDDDLYMNISAAHSGMLEPNTGINLPQMFDSNATTTAATDTRVDDDSLDYVNVSPDMYENSYLN